MSNEISADEIIINPLCRGSMEKYCFFIGTSWSDRPISPYFRALADALVKKGHQVVILVFGENRVAEDHRANPAIYNWPSRRPVKVQDAFFLRNLVKIYKTDCTIANFDAKNIMMSMSWLSGVPCRVSWHHTLSKQIERDTQLPKSKLRFLRLRRRFIYLLATHIVTNSQATQTDVMNVYHIPSRKCKVHNPMLPDPLQHELDKEMVKMEANKVVCVGRFHPSKGQDVLIKAIALLKHLDFYVEFVGSGSTKDQCLHLAGELQVDHMCEFAGFVPHDQVLEKMASAQAVVVPSRREAFGLVNVESLAVGTPVIASRVDGIREIIRDEVDGFLVEADDPEALSEKLATLLLNPDLREEMSVNARQQFLTMFYQGNNINQHAEWYERIVKNAPPRSGVLGTLK